MQGGAAAAAEWQQRAEAEAAARAALQALLSDVYGAAVDARWLQAQGVDTARLLAGDSDGGAAAVEGDPGHGAAESAENGAEPKARRGGVLGFLGM